MKKINALLIVLGLGILLTGCASTKTAKSTEKSVKSKTEYIIRENKKKANKKLENIKNLSLSQSTSASYVGLPTSMEELKSNKLFKFYTFSGQVLNWCEMKADDEVPLTKLEVKIDKSIAGEEIPKGKIVNVVFRGGYAKYSDLTTTLHEKYGESVYSKIDKNKEVFWEDQNAPIPRIGSKVVFVTTIISTDEKGEYSSAAPEFGTWVYNDKTQKYELNNKDLNAQKNYVKLTEEINQAVGK